MRTFSEGFRRQKLKFLNCLECYCQAILFRSLGLVSREERSLTPKVLERSVKSAAGGYVNGTHKPVGQFVSSRQKLALCPSATLEPLSVSRS